MTIFIICCCAGLVCLGVILFFRRREKQTVTRLRAMIAAAAKGEFSPKENNEELASALENDMSRFLENSLLAEKNLQKQQSHIQTMVSDISHQTVTPLSNIVLYSQLLEKEITDPELKNQAAIIHNQGEKLSFLIESLVKASRLETGIITVAPAEELLTPLLNDVARGIAEKAASKEIAVTVEPTTAVAFCDGKWTAEALANIAENAVKYTPRAGRISLSARPYQLFCRVDISDTGIGIAEGEINRIFQRFYRSPAVHKEEGVGIGLYLAREIIELQGGYIKVISAPGKGSVFSVYLPRTKEKSQSCEI